MSGDGAEHAPSDREDHSAVLSRGLTVVVTKAAADGSTGYGSVWPEHVVLGVERSWGFSVGPLAEQAVPDSGGGRARPEDVIQTGGLIMVMTLVERAREC